MGSFNCRGLCERYRRPKPPRAPVYRSGLIQCMTCQVFMGRDGAQAGGGGRLQCKCCHSPVRTGRNKYHSYERESRDRHRDPTRVE